MLIPVNCKILVIFGIFISGSLGDLSCKRTNPRINDCILRASNTLRPYLRKGIQEYGIPRIEPLKLLMVKLEQGTKMVNYKATLSKLQIRGLGTYKLKQVNFDSKNKDLIRLEMKFEFAKIIVKSNYSISGRVLMVPLRGEGVMIAKFSNISANVILKGNLWDKDGEEHLRIVQSGLKLEAGKMEIHMNNLFDGDEVLAKMTNEFLNRHSDEIFKEILPALETVTSMLTNDFVTKVFQQLPFGLLFPKV